MNGRSHGEGSAALVVSPARAEQMLDCGTTRLYQLIGSGELETFKDGKSRKILVSSIRAYIERKLATASRQAG